MNLGVSAGVDSKERQSHGNKKPQFGDYSKDPLENIPNLLPFIVDTPTYPSEDFPKT